MSEQISTSLSHRGDLIAADVVLHAIDRWLDLCKSWEGAQTLRHVAASESFPQDAEEARAILAELSKHGPATVRLVAQCGGDSRLVLGWLDAQTKQHFDSWTKQVWEQVRLEVLRAQQLAKDVARPVPSGNLTSVPRGSQKHRRGKQSSAARG